MNDFLFTFEGTNLVRSRYHNNFNKVEELQNFTLLLRNVVKLSDTL